MDDVTREKDYLSGLLTRVAEKRDRQAFADLFDHFAPRISSFLQKRNASEAEAEDLVQEVMLTVWRKAHLFDPEKAVASTWVFTVARNRYIDRIRRRTKPQLDASEPMLRPEEPEGGEESAFRSAVGRDVKAAIEALPKEQYDVVRLNFIEGLAHTEIAETLGVPLGTVKSRMRLAFAKLRGTLEDWK